MILITLFLIYFTSALEKALSITAIEIFIAIFTNSK